MAQRSVSAITLLVVLVFSAVSLSHAQGALSRFGSIRGQVRLPSGRPAPGGILVTLEMRGGGGAAAQMQTDQSGKFDFGKMQLAIYEVHIRAQGYQSDQQEVNLNMMPMGYVNFTLKPDPKSTPAPVPPEGPGAAVSAVDAGVPDSARKDFEAAEQLIQSGNDFDKAIALLKKAASEYPQYSQAYVVMGVAYSSKQNWSEAETSLQQAIKANANNPAAYLALGAVQNQQKKYDDASKYLLKAAQLAPESADVHFELGRSYYGLQNWPAADTELTKANSLRPNNAAQHVFLGNVLLRERNAEGALKEFQEAVRLDPTGPMAEPTKQVIQKIETALQASQSPLANAPKSN